MYTAVEVHRTVETASRSVWVSGQRDDVGVEDGHSICGTIKYLLHGTARHDTARRGKVRGYCTFRSADVNNGFVTNYLIRFLNFI